LHCKYEALASARMKHSADAEYEIMKNSLFDDIDSLLKGVFVDKRNFFKRLLKLVFFLQIY